MGGGWTKVSFTRRRTSTGRRGMSSSVASPMPETGNSPAERSRGGSVPRRRSVPRRSRGFRERTAAAAVGPYLVVPGAAVPVAGRGRGVGRRVWAAADEP
jgi:hypothetical protein